jgi:hypothetical protein
MAKRVPKRFPGKPTVRYFQRTLTPGERKLLLLTGDGDPVQGWHALCAIGRAAYIGGWRPGMPAEWIALKASTPE